MGVTGEKALGRQGQQPLRSHLCAVAAPPAGHTAPLPPSAASSSVALFRESGGSQPIPRKPGGGWKDALYTYIEHPERHASEIVRRAPRVSFCLGVRGATLHVPLTQISFRRRLDDNLLLRHAAPSCSSFVTPFTRSASSLTTRTLSPYITT